MDKVKMEVPEEAIRMALVRLLTDAEMEWGEEPHGKPCMSTQVFCVVSAVLMRDAVIEMCMGLTMENKTMLFSSGVGEMNGDAPDSVRVSTFKTAPVVMDRNN